MQPSKKYFVLRTTADGEGSSDDVTSRWFVILRSRVSHPRDSNNLFCLQEPAIPFHKQRQEQLTNIIPEVITCQVQSPTDDDNTKVGNVSKVGERKKKREALDGCFVET
jgi:hypothetical protein